MKRLFSKYFGGDPHQNEIARSGVVSIWLGELTSGEEMDNYIFGDFSKDFGFTLNKRSPPEIGVESDQRDIRSLLTGFSWYHDFIDDAVEMIEGQGIKSASCAAVLYCVDFSLIGKRPNPKSLLRFVGTCKFRGG